MNCMKTIVLCGMLFLLASVSFAVCVTGAETGGVKEVKQTKQVKETKQVKQAKQAKETKQAEGAKKTEGAKQALEPVIDPLPGTWAVYCALDKDAEKAFEKAMGGLVGVGYGPIAFARKKAGDGTDYFFICTAILVIREPFAYFASVSFHIDAKGHAGRTHIERISFDPNKKED